MVIDMNETQVRTLEQVRQVLEGTQALEFRRAKDDEGCYGWIDAVLRRFDYRQLPRGDRAPVLAYLQRLSGYSRAQITRLVSRWVAGTQTAGVKSCLLPPREHELGHCIDIPYRVAINEEVELAKSFGGTDGHKYVNGVLDKAATDLRPVEVEARRAARR